MGMDAGSQRRYNRLSSIYSILTGVSVSAIIDAITSVSSGNLLAPEHIK